MHCVSKTLIPTLALAMSATAQSTTFLGSWVTNPTTGAIRLEVGPGATFPTITAALASAAGQIGSVPVTINVRPGTYRSQSIFNPNGETFPIRLPAHGVTIESVDLPPGTGLQNLPQVMCDDLVAPEAIVFDTVGNTALPHSVIRGMRLTMFFNGTSTTRANIRIRAVPSGSTTPPQLVAPELRDNWIEGELDIGVHVQSVAGTVVLPLLERNVIRSPEPFFGLFGVLVQGGTSLVSPVIRCNDIALFQVNLRADGGLDDNCPRVHSNFVEYGIVDMHLTNCAPLVVNNTIAFAFPNATIPVGRPVIATTPAGLRTQGLSVMTLDNNCLWNPDLSVLDVDFVGGVPAFRLGIPLFNVDEDDFLATIGPNLQGSIFPPMFAGGNARAANPPSGLTPQLVQDLHLLPTSPLIGLGLLDDAFFFGFAPLTIQLGTGANAIPVRKDVTYDFDFGSRVSGINFNPDIGGDEVQERNTSLDQVPNPTFGVAVDPIGNLRPDANGNLNTQFVATGTPGDFLIAVISFGFLDTIVDPFNSNVLDNRAVYHNLPVLGWGNIGIDMLPGGSQTIAFTPVPASGSFTINASFGPVSTALLEAEAYVQALTISSIPFGNGTLGEVSRRIQIDINP